MLETCKFVIFLVFLKVFIGIHTQKVSTLTLFAHSNPFLSNAVFARHVTTPLESAMAFSDHFPFDDVIAPAAAKRFARIGAMAGSVANSTERSADPKAPIFVAESRRLLGEKQRRLHRYFPAKKKTLNVYII